LSWITDLFRTDRLEHLPLHIELDLQGENQFAFNIRYQLDGEWIPIQDLDLVSAYGFAIEKDGTRFVFAESDRQKLAALNAVGAARGSDGRYFSEIIPPILAYLRKQANVTESEALREIEIHREPPKPEVVVDYDPASGVVLEAGYRIEGESEVTHEEDLQVSPDGEFCRIGKAYYPIAKDRPAPVRALLKEGVRHIPIDQVPEFFLRDLVLLRSECTAVLTEQAEQVKVIEGELSPRVRVNSVEGGWLNFELDYEIGDYLLPAELIRKARDNTILADPYSIVHADVTQAKRDLQSLDELEALKTDMGYRLPVSRFASLQDFLEGIGGIRELSKEYRAFLESLTDFNADDHFQLPDKIERRLKRQGFELRDYQRAGIHWLNWLRHSHLHGILADDMGLGKTLQSLVALRLAYEHEKSKQHSLIICPKSVIRHWSHELRRIIPSIDVVEYAGANRDPSLFRLDRPIVFISTYTTIRNDIEELIEVPFFYVILDEATRIKNPDARRSRAVKRLNAVHRLTLTGTPVENRPQELWSLFDFLMRGHLGRYSTFERVYAKPILAGDNPQISKKLGERIRPFILRRTKEEVASDLPEKIEMDEWCELTEEQRSLYGQTLEHYRDEIKEVVEEGGKATTFSIFPILTKLKQICDHPAIVTGDTSSIFGRSEKFDLAVQKMEEIQQQGERAVLFSHFLPMLDLFEMALSRKHVAYVRIDGGTSNRQALIDWFDRDGISVMLCSLMAMGHGVNLQSANHVIHVDRWWNPAIEDQATDRVHRIGQSKTVYVYRLIAQGTLEERIDRLQTHKRRMAGDIVEAATRGGVSWTREELMEILKPLDS